MKKRYILHQEDKLGHIIDLDSEARKKIYNINQLKYYNPLEAKLEVNQKDLEDLVEHMNIQNQKCQEAILNLASINVRNKTLFDENKKLKKESYDMKFEHMALENEIMELKRTVKAQLEGHYFANLIKELYYENEWRKEYQRTLESKIRRLKRQIRRFEGVE